jgi:hypothetical protein
MRLARSQADAAYAAFLATDNDIAILIEGSR